MRTVDQLSNAPSDWRPTSTGCSRAAELGMTGGLPTRPNFPHAISDS